MQAQVSYTRKQFLFCFLTMFIALVVIMADRKPKAKVSPLAPIKIKNTVTVSDLDAVIAFPDTVPVH